MTAAPKAAADERQLGDRRVEHALVAVALLQAAGVGEHAAGAATSSPKKITRSSRSSSASSASRMAWRKSTMLMPSNSRTGAAGSGSGAASPSLDHRVELGVDPGDDPVDPLGLDAERSTSVLARDARAGRAPASVELARLAVRAGSLLLWPTRRYVIDSRNEGPAPDRVRGDRPLRRLVDRPHVVAVDRLGGHALGGGAGARCRPGGDGLAIGVNSP